MAASEYPKPASESLKRVVRQIMSAKGRLYAQIPHPDFEDWPSKHQPKKRQAIIGPHLEYQGGTALDIGAYFGAFSLWLDDLGYTVTAVERNKQCVHVIRELRELWGKKFDLFEGSYYDTPNTKHDVIFALNVLHHSLKRKETTEQLEAFLPKLDCKMMIFESHDDGELPMKSAYRPLSPDDFVKLISEKTGLSKVEEIGIDGKRRIFKLKRA